MCFAVCFIVGLAVAAPRLHPSIECLRSHCAGRCRGTAQRRTFQVLSRCFIETEARSAVPERAGRRGRKHCHPWQRKCPRALTSLLAEPVLTGSGTESLVGGRTKPYKRRRSKEQRSASNGKPEMNQLCNRSAAAAQPTNRADASVLRTSAPLIGGR